MKTKRLFSFIAVVIMVFSICMLMPLKISAPLQADAATDVSNLQPVDSTYSLIKSLEGCDLNCFWDVAQWTIGYGNKCPYTHTSNGTYWHQPGGHSITESEARSLFNSKLSGYVNTLKSNCRGLSMTQNQFDALLSATYNHGNVNNCPLKYYLQGSLTESEAREKYYTWCINAGTADEKGLRNRRKKEADLFFKDEPDPNPPSGEYFPKCDSSYDSLIEALDSIGVDSSKAYRKRIAEANGISDYSYSAEQNTYMLNLLKEGRLINPDGSSSSNNKKWYDDMTPVNIGECFTAYIINTACWKHLTAEDNDNVMMTSETRKAEQMWQFTRKADGSYRIINCKTGKALDAGGTNSNLYTYDSCDNSWQSWYIYGSSGAYYLKSQESDYVIDIVGGYTDDGTNTQIYEYNGTDAQKFQIYMIDDFGNLGTIQNLGECFTAYIINTEAWKHLTVEDNDNVMMTSETRKAEQMWQFTRKADGSYRIINCKTGKALDAGGADDNLYTYASCDNGWQSWYIFGSSGSYFLKSQGSNNVIDLTGGYTNDGTNVQMYKTNNTAAQKFQIYMLDGFGNLGTIQNLGEYFTAYIINTEACKHLTVEDDDNVMMTSETRKAEQIWQFTRKTDGSYRIINCKTGKALDAGGADDNLYTYTSCDNGWQSWYIFGNSGSYVLKSQGSNNVIDITGGYTNDGTNVQMYEANGTVAQTFNIEKTILIGDVNADNEVNIADALILQKWLLGVSNTELTNWKEADLCEDGVIDVFDLCLLKKMLINK